jgi:GTPase SAR1 family protein
MVCSYDKRESFEMLRNWINHVKNFIISNNRNSPFFIPIIVMVNKSDIKKERKFKLGEVMKVVDEYDLNIIVYEISAKENTKIDYVFEKVIEFLWGRISLSNDNSLNTTQDDVCFSVNDNSFRKRTRSFQLKNDVSLNEERSNYERELFKQGSCCPK